MQLRALAQAVATRVCIWQVVETHPMLHRLAHGPGTIATPAARAPRWDSAPTRTTPRRAIIPTAAAAAAVVAAAAAATAAAAAAEATGVATAGLVTAVVRVVAARVEVRAAAATAVATAVVATAVVMAAAARAAARAMVKCQPRPPRPRIIKEPVGLASAGTGRTCDASFGQLPASGSSAAWPCPFG